MSSALRRTNPALTSQSRVTQAKVTRTSSSLPLKSSALTTQSRASAARSDGGLARADAVAVRSYYTGLGVPGDQVIELVDESATLANIKRILGTELVKYANNPDDLVLIFFAGHGEMEADRSSADNDGYSKYLLPHDASRADLFGSALSMDELSRILQRLRADRVVLIIDSCFSGAAGGRTP